MSLRKPLPALSYAPRLYQLQAVNLAESLIQSNIDNPWHLFISPTGTGKSIAELMLLSRIPNSILITPRIEIIAGMLDKLGLWVESTNDIMSMGSDYGLYTPIRLRNLLARGDLPFQPSVIILDECHHSLANSWQDIQMYLNGIPVIGFTASPFRGTPKGTEEFRNQWNTFNPMLDLRTAIANNYCSLPSTQILPLIDDDLIDVVNGELVIQQSNDAIRDQFTAIINHLSKYYSKRSGMWDRPTMISVPSTEIATQLTVQLNLAGLGAVKVTQDTPRSARAKAFQQTIDSIKALVQIDVISEGVDLPIRRLFDLRPTMSPVKWLQQIGRIMRPVKDEPPPEYICCCRNLERHCYLMEGMFPPDSIKAAQEGFTDDKGIPIYSRRNVQRAIGLEGLGKFVTTPIHLLNGLTCFAYNLVSVDQFKRTEYFVLLHPGEAEPLRALRESTKSGTSDEGYPVYSWGKWQACESLPDVKGMTSAKAGSLSEKQLAWWNRAAQGFGLNPHKEVNARSFQILPLLKDLRITL